MKKFSCLIPCYNGDNPLALSNALQTICDQTMPAAEVVMVEDGPLTTELKNVIDKFSKHLPIRSIKLAENFGLGYALNQGVTECKYSIIIRADADDVNHPSRFEKLVTFLSENPGVSVVGSWISEFEESSENIYSYRKLPVDSDRLKTFAKTRNPLNHMTVAFRKDDVLSAGNYDPDFRFAQDYLLWVRLLTLGFKIANIPQVLVNARAGIPMLERRSGWRYIRYEVMLQIKFKQMGFISLKECAVNIISRSVIRIIPNKLRAAFYRRFLRENV